MRILRKVLFLTIAAAAIFLFLKADNNFIVVTAPVLEVPEAPIPEAAPPEPVKIADIEPQKPLPNPPKEIKAVYATSWSAGSPDKVNRMINLVKETELNAVVIDVKDYSGYIAYDIENEEIEKYKAKEIRIPRLNALIKKFHDEGIYVIGRITVFQDPVLAKARPDLAVKDKTTGKIWRDNKGLGWMDPFSREVWDYNIAIARDIAERGMDEVNFDYIRFPSDGNLNQMGFPFYDPETTYKQTIIKRFFEHLRTELANVKISADLFGLATVNYDGLGIGQIIEDAYANFDYVSPMVYPSHYAKSFIGFDNPAEHPYEVVKYSMDIAFSRLKNFTQKNAPTPTEGEPAPTIEVNTRQLRPWLQDFDLGADYDAEKVRAQIKAVRDAGVEGGYMLWNPSNFYTREALVETPESFANTLQL